MRAPSSDMEISESSCRDGVDAMEEDKKEHPGL
jgi:hypothetical protein